MSLIITGAIFGALVVGFPLGIAYTLWATRKERDRILRDVEPALDLVREWAAEGCSYNERDGCTEEAMRIGRHGRCLVCTAWWAWSKLPVWAR